MDDNTHTTLAAGTPVTGEAMPEPPPEVIEAAREAPDHWLAMVDLTWSGQGPPPLWAVIGQWRSGPTGEIEDWRDNPEYRPSPQMLDWSEPTDAVDQAVQLAATGYGPVPEVARTLAAAEVSYLVTAAGAPLPAASPEGTPVVPVYTSEDHLEPVGRLLVDRRPVAELLERLPAGHALYVNPTGAVSMLVEPDAVRAAVEERAPGRVAVEAAIGRPGTGAGGAEPVRDGEAGERGGLPIGKPARTAAVGAGMASSGARGGAV
ncbi:type VII secretion system-associated protein [Streptomyces sp. NBC_01525]|uniref:Type VII secretion system-associated protein n=1 Tax=Streptomyces benahoarensis TaxID=2595054 RepID=A0A553ZEG9_9ACTN|nr:type VII secretion system-associated protein [Streptomyces benahoarensis]TSB21203.1 type VII secretion system-associated protein [Streptomyces benahoarensis]TSB39838.1 type VII secretion system-associated protein [Streptomyces benahoarensis]